MKKWPLPEQQPKNPAYFEANGATSLSAMLECGAIVAVAYCDHTSAPHSAADEARGFFECNAARNRLHREMQNNSHHPSTANQNEIQAIARTTQPVSDAEPDETKISNRDVVWNT